MNFNEIMIYDNKSLSDLFREIHANVIVKQGKIEELIVSLMPLINNPQAAVQLVPMIKEYLEVGVKNDELLVKIAAIAQRYASSTAKSESENDGIISEEEKRKLLGEAQKFMDAVKDDLDK